MPSLPAMPRRRIVLTLFSRIIEGEIPGRFVWRDERCVAFLTIAPLRPGHTLVVPRAEVDEWTDADDDLMAHLMVVARRIGAAQKTGFDAPRAGLVVAGFEVAHLDVTYSPRGPSTTSTSAKPTASQTRPNSMPPRTPCAKPCPGGTRRSQPS